MQNWRITRRRQLQHVTFFLEPCQHVFGVETRHLEIWRNGQLPALTAPDVPAKISSDSVPGMWHAPLTLMAAIGWALLKACASLVLVSESPVPALKVCVFDTVCP